MAIHAHSTRTPLLGRRTRGEGLLGPSLHGGGIVAAGGPVSRAIVAGRGEHVPLAPFTGFMASKPAVRRVSDFDPNDLPEIYAMGCEGTCLEPTVMDGTLLMFSSVEPCTVGDLVVLYRRPELVAEGHHQGIVKRIVMMPPPWVKLPFRENPKSTVRLLVICEQLNPRRQYAIPCEDLLAIHKCLGPVPEGTNTYKASDIELRKLAVTQRAGREVAEGIALPTAT